MAGLSRVSDPNCLLRTSGADVLRQEFETATEAWKPPDPPPRQGAPARSAASGREAAFRPVSTADIMAAAYPDLSWAVEGYIAEGFSVLAGRQKLGKSRMALDVAVAIASGGRALGTIPCEPGDVLYIDLENGERRVQRRILEAYPDVRKRPDLRRLQWVFDAPKIGEAFLEMLDAWRSSVTTPRLVIIDVLQRVKPATSNRAQNAYERDYDCYSELQSWATGYGIAVLGLHHTRKGGADDPLEALSGSNGLAAVADTTLVLDRDSQGATLYVRGRDVEEKDSALTSVNGQWYLQGDATDVRRSEQRQRILAALAECSEAMSPRDIADVTGATSQSVRKMLPRMVKAGDIERVKRGAYALPCHNGHNRHDKDGCPENASETGASSKAPVVTSECDIADATTDALDGNDACSGDTPLSERHDVTVVTDVTGGGIRPPEKVPTNNVADGGAR
nr:AAA family ATPase [Acuticoccus kalidii]